MYSASAIARRREAFLADPRFGQVWPDGVPEYAVADAHALTRQILSSRDPDSGEALRPLTAEESRFAAAARVRIMYDAPWYLETFVWIDEEGHGIRPLYPLWNSQRFMLERLARLEDKYDAENRPDGLLLNVLKVRQVGISTLGMGLVSQRIFTQPYLRAIAGSDTEEQARYLFRMVERIYDQLPFFLKPEKIVPYAAGRELHLANKSSIKTAWGKTTRGALQEAGGKKGNIERGRTNSVVHISELATWDNPEQLDSALLPGIPRAEQTLVIFESTAEIAGDWWHRHWQATAEGTGRFANLFIPWCVKYERQPPIGWTPNQTTLAVAAQIERDSFSWVGETLRCSAAQLYWYESERAYYTKKNQLLQFFKEYPSNPEECFQFAGRSVFTIEEIAQIDQKARPVIDVWAVEPSREIAELRRLPSDDAAALAQVAADAKRYPAPISLKMPTKQAEQYAVPPGFGFRRLTATELEQLPSLRHSVLTIYEYPRARGRRRYVLGIDVGDGLGQDYSVISVIREPTVEEPAEEVAQYVSNTIRPSLLAFVADAIGRFYCDEDALEALAAVEINNHGVTVQEMLQLHLGYTQFYVWEVVDAGDQSARYTKRIGWQTTTRTRPILLEKFHDAVTTTDPISGLADFRLNSPITRSELRYFVTEGLLGEAEHAAGQHDDAIFGSAIGYYVAYKLSGGEQEPVAERRRRRALLREQHVAAGIPRPDYRNTPISAAAADRGIDDDAEEAFGDEDAGLYFSDRGRGDAPDGW